MEQLECRHCGAAIAAADVHAELAIARCARCSAITDLAGRAAAGARRAPAPLPAELEVEEGSGTLHLSWRSSSFKRFVALALCVLLLGSFSEVWPRVAFPIRPEAGGLFPLLLALVYLVLGTASGYLALVGFVNRTHVWIGGGAVRIRQSPLPWKGNRTLRPADIKQLYAEERPTQDDGALCCYRLLALLRSRRKPLVLIGDLDDAAQALYLEQRVEEELGIVDRPVAGELAGQGPRPDAAAEPPSLPAEPLPQGEHGAKLPPGIDVSTRVRALGMEASAAERDGQASNALGFTRTALALRPDDTGLRWRYANLLERIGRLELAVREAEAAAAKSPGLQVELDRLRKRVEAKKLKLEEQKRWQQLGLDQAPK